LAVTAAHRFTKNHPCPACGGYDSAPRHRGTRDYGFLSEGGQLAHYTRDECANGLPQNPNSDSYAHRLARDCRCGVRHDPGPGPSRGASAKNRPFTIIEAYEYIDENGALRNQVLRCRYDNTARRPSGCAGRTARADGHGTWLASNVFHTAFQSYWRRNPTRSYS
jgi:hypothetical protein